MTHAPVPHRPADDIVGISSGVLLVSLGLSIMKAGAVVTGGTAGLSLLLSYAVPVDAGVLFLAINLPFFFLAARGKGWSFTIRSGLAIFLVSLLTAIQPYVLRVSDINAVYAAIAGLSAKRWIWDWPDRKEGL